MARGVRVHCWGQMSSWPGWSHWVWGRVAATLVDSVGRDCCAAGSETLPRPRAGSSMWCPGSWPSPLGCSVVYLLITSSAKVSPAGEEGAASLWM